MVGECVVMCKVENTWHICEEDQYGFGVVRKYKDDYKLCPFCGEPMEKEITIEIQLTLDGGDDIKDFLGRLRCVVDEVVGEEITKYLGYDPYAKHEK